MNKEQAELYVNSVKESKINPLSFFLAMNLVCLAIAVAFHHTIIFCIVAGCFALISILLMALDTRKASYFKVTVLAAMQLAMISVSLNCIVFALYQFVDKFVLWEYLVSVGIQVVVSLLSLIFFKIYAEKFKGNSGVTIAGTVGGSLASASCASTLLLCHLLSPSFSAIVSSFAILLNILSCLFGVCVAGVLHRAYLMKKYNISRKSDVNSQPIQTEQ